MASSDRYNGQCNTLDDFSGRIYVKNITEYVNSQTLANNKAYLI